MLAKRAAASSTSTGGRTQAGLRPLVRIRNAAVRGRVRFSVRGLYRSPELAEQLRHHLSRSAGIRVVNVNTLTGTILVEYSGLISVHGLEHDIELYVRELVISRARVERAPRGTRNAAALAPQVSPPELDAWHAAPLDQVVHQLKSNAAHGLEAAEAERRLAAFGPNALQEAVRRSALGAFLRQFASVPAALLGGSAVVSLLTGGLADAVLISAVLVVNASIGYATESRAERVIRSLDKEESPAILVFRDGKRIEMETHALVVGDVVVLTPGPLPADMRLLKADHMSVDESALTGESTPVDKSADTPLVSGLPLADRRNMVYSGTVLTGGSGLGLVVATGGNTELGRVQALVAALGSPETPLQRNLRTLGRQTVGLSGAVCAGVLVVGVLRGIGLVSMLKTAVSLAIAAVPEGLPAVGTTTLAFGVTRMQRHNVHVRRLMAIEGLGSIGALGFDKTGTITLNRMGAARVQIDHAEYRLRDGQFFLNDALVDPRASTELQQLLLVCALCNEVQVDAAFGDGGTWRGSPTEVALMQLAADGGVRLDALAEHYPRIKTKLRTETAPFMLTVHRPTEGGLFVAVKGSPTEVLKRSTRYLEDGEVKPLDERRREHILAQNERLASRGLRVLAAAYRRTEGRDDFVFLGLVALKDPPRAGIKDLIQEFHAAGIQTLMMTGDQHATAEAIAKELGFNGHGELNAVDAQAMATASEDDWAKVVEEASVFARVSPTEKLRIVSALQRSGRLVAMIGDGVNDSPAIKAANVGIAMGNGSKAAREAADVVLGDDDLHTMLEAIRQGRTIRINLIKALKYLLATNLSEIVVTLGGVVSGQGSPLNPMQLLWINLLTDVFPALALALEPPEPDVMSRPPVDPLAPLLTHGELRRLVRESVSMAIGPLSVYHTSLRRGGAAEKASAVAFISLTLTQLLHTLTARSDTISMLKRLTGDAQLAPNPLVSLAMGAAAAAQVAAGTVPGLRAVLGTRDRLDAVDYLAVGVGALLPFVVNEVMRTAGSAARSSVDP